MVQEAHNSELLTTGVDKLVQLVKKKKKITVKEAAKLLSVSEDVIKEWAEFLEEEGIVDIKYSLVSVYISEKKISQNQINEKKKKLSDEKQIFLRQGTSVISQIEKDSKDINELRKEFEKLKEEIEMNSENLKSKLDELNRYHNVKRKLETELNKEKETYRNNLEENQKILDNEIKRYNELLNEIKKEKDVINKESEINKSLEKGEEEINNKIDYFKTLLQKIEEEIKKQKLESIKNNKILNQISDRMNELRQSIIEQKNKIKSLEEEHRSKESKILELEQNLLKKYEKTKIGSVDVTNLKKRYESYINKKAQIELKLDKIETEKEKLEKSLRIIVNRAQALSALSKSKEVTQNIHELEKKFNELIEKKKKFEEDLNNVISSFKS